MKKSFTAIGLLIFCVSFAQYGRQPYEYAPPQKLDISSLSRAQSTLQNRYNSNVEEIQSTINRLSRHINNLDITDDQRDRISSRFKRVVAGLQDQNINYSSSSQTQGVISYLYDTTNKIIRSETE